MPTRWIVLIGMVVAKIAYSFHLQSAAVVAPGLMEDLALNTATLGTLIGLFTLPGLILAVPSSYVSSRYNAGRVP